MPLLKRVTGDYNGTALASYYESGDTANANLLRNLSGTGLTFVPYMGFDFSTDALGYVQADQGASLTFRANNANEFTTADYDGSTNDSDYWVSFWIRGVVLEGEAPQAGQDTSLLTFSDAQNVLFRLRTRSTDSADGFSFHFVASVSGNSTRILQLSGAITATNYPQLSWNTWHHVTIHVRRGASSAAAGMAEVYANGRLVVQLSGFDGTNAQLSLGSGTDRNIILPALSNVRWQLAGPIESWSGRDVELRPLYERDGANRTVVKNFCAFHLKHSDLTQGRDWEASGTGAVASESYTSSGTAPYRSRLILSGNGNTPVATTVENLGGPYYRDGWQTVAFSDIVVPSGCTGKIELLNAAGDAAVLTLNIVSGELRQDSTKVLDWSMPSSPSSSNQSRHSLFIHLGADGQAAVTLHQHNVNLQSAQGVWGAALPAGWTPQSLGKLRFTATTTSLNVELGQVGIGFEFDVFGIDSQVSNSFSGGSVHALRHLMGYSRGFNDLQERQSIPGGNWRNRRLGLRRQWGFAVFGVNGLQRDQFQVMVLPGLAHARNLRFVLPDLGSINDILGGSAGQGAEIAERIVAQFKEFLDVVLPNGNRVWVTTMLTRDRTGIPNATYTANRLAAIATVNQLLRASLPIWNRSGRITLSDIHRDYADNRNEYPSGDAMWSDDTHPSGSSTDLYGLGYVDVARRMIQITTIPRSSQRNRVVAGNRRLARTLLGR